MAISLFLADGSVRLIFNEDDRQHVLARLIREYLGADCEDLFCILLEEKKNSSANTGDDYELIEELDAILALFSNPRLDRKKLHEALRRCKNNIYNNL